MTCRAILHATGEISIPLLLVRSGELTPRQCDKEFNGFTGVCPTCQELIDNTDFSDGSTFAAAMAKLKERQPIVKYRGFGYGNDGGVEPWKVCYWCHRPNYWSEIPFRDCQKPDRDTHRVNLAVIRKFYETDFYSTPGIAIKTEPRLRMPSDPPRPYSPDLAIYGPNNERLAAVEYQRSYEPFEKFLERDSLRRAEKWAVVDWWFDDTKFSANTNKATLYEKCQEHRTYLAGLSVHFYRCWVDPDNLKLTAEYGKCGEIAPSRSKRIVKQIERANLSECSTSNIINGLRGQPEYEIVREYAGPISPLAGSALCFKANINFSLAQQAAAARAVLARKRRLEEQDKRHRKYAHELRISDTQADIGCGPEHFDINKPLPGHLASTPSHDQASVPQLFEAERIKKWGVKSGETGILVRWMRGKQFSGMITKWLMDRPVITDLKSGSTRWAYDTYDFVVTTNALSL